jgi:hypothetical protein
MPEVRLRPRASDRADQIKRAHALSGVWRRGRRDAAASAWNGGSASSVCRGFRPLRISTNVRKSPGLTLTDGAGGFLPGVPLGCFRIVGLLSHIRPDHAWGPGPPGGNNGAVGPRPREATPATVGAFRCHAHRNFPAQRPISLSNASINRPTTKPCRA